MRDDLSLQGSTIREYRASDRAALESCFWELQEFERGIDPHRVPSEEIVGRYVDSLLQQCQDKSGQLYVAEHGGLVVGFTCVWLAPTLSGMISRIQPVAYISDLLVSSFYRGRGLGKALIRQAEVYAASLGATHIAVHVLAGNRDAWEVYRRAGFADYEVELLKAIAPPSHG